MFATRPSTIHHDHAVFAWFFAIKTNKKNISDFAMLQPGRLTGRVHHLQTKVVGGRLQVLTSAASDGSKVNDGGGRRAFTISFHTFLLAVFEITSWILDGRAGDYNRILCRSSLNVGPYVKGACESTHHTIPHNRITDHVQQATL